MTVSITRLIIILLIPVALFGCTANPQIAGIDTYATTTPETHSEARAFYLGPSDSDTYLRPLMHPFEVAREARERKTELLDKGVSEGSPALSEAQLYGDEFVVKRQPLSIILTNALVPKFSGRRDIAVILDILTKSDEKVKPLVVWYQRDVYGGQLLNFENLLVYYNESWDDKVPPYFRLRMLDVKTEDNQSIQKMLQSTDRIAKVVGSLYPHPAIPGVQLGLQAAELLLTNRKNEILLDYTVQFYSASQVHDAGDADLGLLRKGHWMAFGKKTEVSPEFWTSSFTFDQRTKRLYLEEDLESLPQLPIETNAPGTSNRVLIVDATLEAQDAPAAEASVAPSDDSSDSSASPDQAADTPEPEQVAIPRVALDSPYILLTVSTAESIVPTIVLDRSSELLDMLSSETTNPDYDGIESKLATLGSSIKAYIGGRRLQREETNESMRNVIELLRGHSIASRDGATQDELVNLLSPGAAFLLTMSVERATNRGFGGVDDILAWWDAAGKDGAYSIDPATGKRIWTDPSGQDDENGGE